MRKALLLLSVVVLLSGCAGHGFNKKTELMPDEFSLSVDSNPENGWRVDEVTGGFKWKLK